MTQALAVFTIPPHVAFVEALAGDLWRQAEADPLRLASMLVLLPTRRSCRLLREAFLRVTGGKAALLPRMQPLGDVDEVELYFAAGASSLAIPPAIPPLRRQMLLTRLILKKDSGLPVDQAAQLAAALGDLLDQVQTERRDFADLEKLVPENLAAHWQQTLDFLKIVTAAWPLVLAEEGCLDSAARRNRILETQAETWRAAPPPLPVIAAGSTGSVPAVADLLTVIAGLPQGRVVLPGLDQALDEAAWQALDESHPQFGMKQWLEQAGVRREDVAAFGSGGASVHRVRLLQEAMRPAEETQAWRDLTPEVITRDALTGLSRLELDHQQEEAEVIALRLRAALEEPGKTASLVTPDRALAERVAAALRRWGIEANDSAGASLAALPTGSFLLEALRAAAPQASPVDDLALLKHPLAACGLDAAECRRRARQIEVKVWRGVRRADGWRGVATAQDDNGAALIASTQLADWINALADLFEPVTATWNEKRPLTERLSQHIALAEGLAAKDEVPGAARLWRGEAGEAAALWLDDWRQAAQDFPPITGNDYTQLFASLLRQVMVRPAYGQHPRLSILGPLEARLHHADLVILGGLNEGTWPPEATIDPWLSRPMKKEFGLPLPERRLGLAAHDFVQLASAPEVLLTRARRVGTAPTVPSRYVLQIEAVLQALGYHGPEQDALAPAEPWQYWARQLDKPEVIAPCRRPEPCPPVAVRPRRLSVTEIGTWLRNPYAIYAKHVLKLKKLDDIDADVTASERGTMIHAALERLVVRHKDAWPSEPEALRDLLAIGRELFAPFADRPQVAAFWWPRFERIAAWFVENEAKRRKTGIRILAAERDGAMSLAGGAFTLRGRVDRIDLLPDGRAAILDYKTGGVPSQKDVASGIEPQLPLLALMLEAGGFAELGRFEAGELEYWHLQGATSGEKLTTIKGDIAALMAEAQDGLEALLAAFAKPSTAYEAVPRPRFALRYDDYAHLARLEEWGRFEGEA